MEPLVIMLEVQMERRFHPMFTDGPSPTRDTYYKVKVIRQSLSAAVKREWDRNYYGIGVQCYVEATSLKRWMGAL